MHKGKLGAGVYSDHKMGAHFGRCPLTSDAAEWHILNTIGFTRNVPFIFLNIILTSYSGITAEIPASYLRIKPETFSQMKHLLRKE